MSRARAKMMTQVCTTYNWAIKKTYKRGKYYAVRAPPDDNIVTGDSDAIIYVKITENDPFTVDVRCYGQDADSIDEPQSTFPKETYGNVYSSYYTTFKLRGELCLLYYYGICCFCGHQCHEASQACGSCMRGGPL